MGSEAYFELYAPIHSLRGACIYDDISCWILSDITTIPGAFMCLAWAVFAVNGMYPSTHFEYMNLLSYIVHFADLDSLRALYLTEKRILHHIARHFLWRNVTIILGTDQKHRLGLFSFDSRCLSAIRSLSIVVHGYLDVCLSSSSSVLASMININHVRVSGGSGPFMGLILENTTASLVTLELDGCYAEPQDFADMVPITIQKLHISRCHSNLCFLLGPLMVEDLEVPGPDLDGECMPIDVTLRRLTDAHLGIMKRLCLVDTCRDAGCRDFLHLTRALEGLFSSLKELVLDIPLSHDTHNRLVRLIPAFPLLKESYPLFIVLSEIYMCCF
ncbi:uncharacterized protein ARMOST_21683 [Armillaria ostoyae]|uniref:Uncharacterized protein n=1 Tax=Armillaria ostoyae TaxID=47428 RepID=A0A284SAS4_ARMOS|nr:uncharacterized protein ARMOST_21683 [Armillaria ostoyae]